MVFDKILPLFQDQKRAEMVKGTVCDNDDNNNLHKGIVWNTKEVIESIDLGLRKPRVVATHPILTVATACNRIHDLTRIPFVFFTKQGFKVTDKRYFSFFFFGNNQSRRGPGRLSIYCPGMGCPV